MGGVYLFSGAVKAVDPYGTVLKVGDYMGAFGAEWLAPVAPVAAVVLIALEVLLGVALVVGARERRTLVATLAVTLVFTAVTVWLVVADPISDCGCFGDVVKLTNGQTLAKNVALVALVVGAMVLRRGVEVPRRAWADRVAVGVCALAALLAVVWLVRLPVVELFPFGRGVNIAQAMEQELALDNGAAGEAQVVCRNIVTGQEEAFDIDDSTWWDEEFWEWVRNVEPEGGTEQAPRVRASDFVLFDQWGGNVTDEVLATEGVVHLVLVQRVEMLGRRQLGRVARAVEQGVAERARVVVLTASQPDDALVRLQHAGVDMMAAELYNMDITTMQALVRKPLGRVVLRNGTVVRKDGLTTFDNR